MLQLNLFKFNTALGSMTALTDKNCLYYLKFDTETNDNLHKFVKKHNIAIIENQLTENQFTKNHNIFSDILQNQITQYLSGEILKFNINITIFGTDFTKLVLKNVLQIPIGKTAKYQEIAIQIGVPNSYRAVANALAANNICIIVPCHRVIKSNGNIGGYNGGIERKKYLLELENCLI